MGIIYGSSVGVIRTDTRSLDYGLCRTCRVLGVKFIIGSPVPTPEYNTAQTLGFTLN